MYNYFLKTKKRSTIPLLLIAFSITNLQATTISILVPALHSGETGSRDSHYNWTFTSKNGSSPRVGTYACGSYWVAPAAGDNGVILERLSGTQMEGQTDFISLDSDPITEKHGLLDGSKSYGSYDPSQNDLTKLPLEYAPNPNSCISLVAAIQRNETETTKGGTKAIVGENTDSYCVVTILPEPPKDKVFGKNSIRPNITGLHKDFYTWSDIDLNALPSLANFPRLTPEEIEEIRLRWVHSTEILSFGIYNGSIVKFYSEGGRAFRAQILVDDYASGTAMLYTQDLLSLMSSGNNIEEKKAALAAMLSYGLDIYHCRYDYPGTLKATWTSGAGQHSGEYLPAAFLSTMLLSQEKATQISKIPIQNFSNDLSMRGPQELRQLKRGATGVILWGDNHAPIRADATNLVEADRRYWADLKNGYFYLGSTREGVGGGKKTAADPYGYIDGDARYPGYGYQSVSIGAVKGLAACMLAMPKLRKTVNSDIPIEYADRITRHGTWAFPDPVAPPPPIDQGTCDPWRGGTDCAEFRQTWGPNPEDVHIPIKNGEGRFDKDTYHGTPVNEYYLPALARDHWDSLLENYEGDLFEDNVTSVNKTPRPDITIVNELAYLYSFYHNATIHYTLDGSTPNTKSPRYDSPIDISEATSIRAFATVPDKENSDIRSFALSPAPESPSSLQTN